MRHRTCPVLPKDALFSRLTLGRETSRVRSPVASACSRYSSIVFAVHPVCGPRSRRRRRGSARGRAPTLGSSLRCLRHIAPCWQVPRRERNVPWHRLCWYWAPSCSPSLHPATVANGGSTGRDCKGTSARLGLSRRPCCNIRLPPQSGQRWTAYFPGFWARWHSCCAVAQVTNWLRSTKAIDSQWKSNTRAPAQTGLTPVTNSNLQEISAKCKTDYCILAWGSVHCLYYPLPHHYHATPALRPSWSSRNFMHIVIMGPRVQAEHVDSTSTDT